MTRQNDTRNNWMTFRFVCKYRYNCLRKQTVIDNCTAALKELEQFGFKFDEIGYGGNHTHFLADLPKRYSTTTAITMFKSHTAKRIFEKHPNFRKRYPKGEFWSEYEHHESTGMKEFYASKQYIKNQQKHHNVIVIDDRNKLLQSSSAELDTVTP